MKTNLNILVYPGSWSNEIAPMYTYTGPEGDTYLVVEPWDLANTPFRESAEGIYSAILELRAGDTDFTLIHYSPGICGTDVETFQTVDFHGNRDQVPILSKIPQSLPLSRADSGMALSMNAVELVTLSTELGDPKFTVFDRAEVESYLDGEDVPTREMVMFNHYFPNLNHEKIVQENSNYSWSEAV